MNKKQVMKYLIEHYQGKKNNSKEFDMEILINDKVYHIVFLKVGPKAQLTINSKTHFEVAIGRLNGIRFKKKQSKIYHFQSFADKPNKIVFLLGTPFRILKYLNESDIEDITCSNQVYDYLLLKSLNDFDNLANK